MKSNSGRTASVCLNLTDEILGVFWSHHVQSQGLQVPVVLLDHRVLKCFTPDNIIKKTRVRRVRTLSYLKSAKVL